MNILELKITNYEYPKSASDNTTILGKLILQKTSNNVIIGFLEYCIFFDKRESYITRLRIDYSFQGNNFASLLLKTFIEYANQKKLSFILASLEPDPIDAYNDLALKYGYEAWENLVFDEDLEDNTHFIKEHDLLIQERFAILKKIFFKAGFVKCEDFPNKENKTQLTVILYL